MPNCSFCGESVAKGTGLMYVYKSGRIAWFDSKKCEKNLLVLKRKPRKFKWTKSYEKGKVVESVSQENSSHIS
jgi:large subunit ribosomal protein L24e